MLFAMLLFTAMDAAAKYLMADYPVWQIIWVRFASQTVLVALYLNRHLPALLVTRHPKLQAARSLFQFGATALFFVALGYIGLAEAHALTDISPVLITIGAAVFLGERLGIRRIIGVTIALIGALIIIRPGFGVFAPAALLPLACAVCYAAYALTTRFIGDDDDPWTSIFYASVLGTVVMTVGLPFVFMPIALVDLPLFLGVGLLGTGAQFCLVRAFTVAEASVIAPFGYAGILAATVWGIVIFDEYPDQWTVVGALVIVGAGLYVWHRETRSAQTR
jgi:drug/metabolite transporter (DMT)-like permease